MKNPFIHKESQTMICARLALIAKYGTDEEKHTLIDLWADNDNDVWDSHIAHIIEHGNDDHRKKIYKLYNDHDKYADNEMAATLIRHASPKLLDKILKKISKLTMLTDDDNDDCGSGFENYTTAIDAIMQVDTIDHDSLGKYIFSENKLLAYMAKEIIDKKPVDTN